MSTKTKYYAINSCELLASTGNASKIEIKYAIADDKQGTQNLEELNIVMNVSYSVVMAEQLKNKTAMFAVAYLREKIEKALENGEITPKEDISITSYDKNFPKIPDVIDMRLEEWFEVVVIDKPMGFLSI